ncbi:hypothetical protein TUM4644_13620 [Shewanella colwelliana]|uniref:tyrosine-type recombinase/integrase n=1 Tax=Shewanella colwelliana TaxID=23 RepID=UPI001BBD7497|nr:tyrosine-type recombinase/integrase [Shewanella colwelliana]GIU22016.1 hypothetical protein TUM4644_13620 [Shewanella colwelliana]
MAKSLQMNFASVMTFHDNGKPQSLTKYDSGNDNSDSDSAIKHSLELEKVNVQHRVANNSVELEKGGMKLSEAIEAYKDWQSKLKKKSGGYGISHKAAQSRYTHFEILLLALGSVGIESISRPDIRSVLAIIENMPKRNIKPYSENKDLRVWVEAAKNREIPEQDLVASNQKREALKDYQSLFSRFLTDELELIKTSPTTAIKVDVEYSSYACLSRKQMSVVVNHWHAKDDSDYKWIVLLAAYSGARRGDIFNLKLSSVVYDGDVQRYYLDIKQGKTKAAIRKIPLHNKLIEMGFLRFVDEQAKHKSPEGKLFSSFKTDSYITTRFRDSLDELGFAKVNEQCRRFSFHSMRHAVVTQSRRSNLTVLVQKVVGHKITSSGETDRYTGNYELPDLLCVIDSLDW